MVFARKQKPKTAILGALLGFVERPPLLSGTAVLADNSEHYPTTDEAVWQSDVFQLEPLPHSEFGYGIIQKAQTYFPNKWPSLSSHRLNAVMNGALIAFIRDFIAFPKNNQGRDMMIDAPDGIKLKQLEELGIRVVTTV